MFSDPDAADRAHQNLADYSRFTRSFMDGAETMDEDGVLLYAAPIDWPAFRTGIRVDATVAPEAMLDAAGSWFPTRGASHVLFVRCGPDDDLLAAAQGRGYIEVARPPELVCESRCTPPPVPPDVLVELATSRADVTAYAGVAGAAFADMSFPAADVTAFLDSPALLSDEVALAIAKRGDEVVAGAFTVRTGEGAYTSFVATLASARRGRLGEAVTALATNAAFDRGADLVSLEASPFGEGVYLRMGYREVGRYAMMFSFG